MESIHGDKRVFVIWQPITSLQGQYTFEMNFTNIVRYDD